MNMFESFCHVCDQLLLEYSTTFNILKNPDGSWHTGAKELLDQVITNKGMIPHDVQWEPINPAQMASWAKSSKKGVMIVLCERGTAMIEPRDDDFYQALISSETELVRLHRMTRYGAQFLYAFAPLVKGIQELLGLPLRAYVTKDLGTKSVEKLRKKRKAAAPKRMSYEQIVLRFKPLWEKTLVQAMADVKGWYSQLIKNDAYNKAQKKMRQLTDLRTMLDNLEAGNMVELKKGLLVYITTAVHMAAAHHYPTPAGTWGEAWSETAGRYVRRYKAPGVVEKFLADIENGDMNKLGSVLGYLKQELVKGH